MKYIHKTRKTKLRIERESIELPPVGQESIAIILTIKKEEIKSLKK